MPTIPYSHVCFQQIPSSHVCCQPIPCIAMCLPNQSQPRHGCCQPISCFRGCGQPIPCFRGCGQPIPCFRACGQPISCFRACGQPTPPRARALGRYGCTQLVCAPFMCRYTAYERIDHSAGTCTQLVWVHSVGMRTFHVQVHSLRAHRPHQWHLRSVTMSAL
jgi:hypothetical protein